MAEKSKEQAGCPACNFGQAICGCNDGEQGKGEDKVHQGTQYPAQGTQYYPEGTWGHE